MIRQASTDSMQTADTPTDIISPPDSEPSAKVR